MEQGKIYSAEQMDALTLSAIPKLVFEKQKRTEAYFILLMERMKEKSRLGIREQYLKGSGEHQDIDYDLIVKELKRLGYTVSDYLSFLYGDIKDGLIRW